MPHGSSPSLIPFPDLSQFLELLIQDDASNSQISTVNVPLMFPQRGLWPLSSKVVPWGKGDKQYLELIYREFELT